MAAGSPAIGAALNSINWPLQFAQRLEQGRAVLEEDAGPQRRVAGGDARGVAEAGGGQLAQLRRQDAGQRRGQQVRQVARHGQGAVVLVRPHDDHARVERLPEGDGALDGGAVGLRRRRHDGDAALEQVGVGVLRAALLRAGQRVAADEGNAGRQLAVEGADDGRLGAAGVGQQRAVAAGGGDGEDLLRDQCDGRAEDGNVGPPYRVGEVEADVVDGAEFAGAVRESRACRPAPMTRPARPRGAPRGRSSRR